MGILDLDFAGVDTSGYKLVTEGEHGFEVTEVQEADDKPQLILTLMCNDGSESNGESIRHFVTMTASAAKATKRFLQALLQTAIEGPLTEYLSDPQDLVGMQLEANVTHTLATSKKSGKEVTYANIDIWTLWEPETAF